MKRAALNDTALHRPITARGSCVAACFAAESTCRKARVLQEGILHEVMF